MGLSNDHGSHLELQVGLKSPSCQFSKIYFNSKENNVPSRMAQSWDIAPGFISHKFHGVVCL